MCKLIASGKNMSEFWIIACVLCCIPLIESEKVYIVENNIDWFTAFHKCKMLYGRLPGVSISDQQIKLQDLSVTTNISSPFWVEATYDFLDVNVSQPRYGFLFPRNCCERISVVSRKQQVECGDCSEKNRFLCALSRDKIYSFPIPITAANWHDAFQECKRLNLNLPKSDNADFLERLQHVPMTEGGFWVDGIREINLTPDIGIQTRTCLHSFMGSIHDGNCNDTSMATVCTFDNKTSSSTLSTYIPSIITESSSEADHFQMKTSETNYTIHSSKLTKSMQHQMITDATTAPSPIQHSIHENLIDTATDGKSVIVSSKEEYTTEANTTATTSPMFSFQTAHTTGIWPILGGVLGALFVIIIVVIMIIVLLRKRRMKMDPPENLDYTANNKPTTKITPQMNRSYNTVPGESFALEVQITASPKVPTAEEEEPVTYAKPQKVKKNCRDLLEDQFSITQTTDEKENTGLYSMVQKGQKTHGTSKNLSKDEVLGKDYYDISFMKPEREEAVGNVYNKANFNRHGYDDEQHAVNMYDKANFRHKVLETDSGNGYEKETFHRPEGSNYDTTCMMNLTIDSTYDLLK